MTVSRLAIAAVFAMLSLPCLSTSSYAAPTGHLDVANCAGGSVTLTATTVTWAPTTGLSGYGCVQTGANTSVTDASGVLGPGVQGFIENFSLTNGMVPNFMLFNNTVNLGATQLAFDLTSIGPAAANTVCAAANNPTLPTCSPVFTISGDGSFTAPYFLTPTATGTSITLIASGIARDASATTSTWTGAFTTQIAGKTPLQIQNDIQNSGSEVSTYSGDFTLTISSVPEPTSLAMIGAGLLLVSAFRRRIRS